LLRSFKLLIVSVLIPTNSRVMEPLAIFQICVTYLTSD